MNQSEDLKVYLVWRDDCGERELGGIFSARASADRFALLLGGNTEIEEFDVDAFPDVPDGLWPFDCVIFSDGSVRCERASFWDVRSIPSAFTKIPSLVLTPVVFGNKITPPPISMYAPYYVRGLVWATDEDHAKALTEEAKNGMIERREIEPPLDRRAFVTQIVTNMVLNHRGKKEVENPTVCFASTVCNVDSREFPVSLSSVSAIVDILCPREGGPK
jgi:hypothetical protein